MSIATYSDLKAQIASMLSRSNLDAQITNAILLFEAKWNADEKSYSQEASATINTTAGVEKVNQPADCFGIVSLSLPNKPALQQVSLNHLRTEGVYGAVGQPRIFSTFPGSQIALNPVPDGVYALELIYRQRLPALTDAAPTNWLLTRWPHIYLYGSLMFLLDHLQNPERAAQFKADYAAFIAGMKSAAIINKLGDNPVMRPPAGGP